jgi:hypothetical protein
MSRASEGFGGSANPRPGSLFFFGSDASPDLSQELVNTKMVSFQGASERHVHSGEELSTEL